MLIYDIEIIKAIPPKNASERIDGIEYCAGWKDHANMGVSVICAYEYDYDRYRVFTESNFTRFAEIATDGRMVVGFNSIPFDNAVLRASGIVDIPDDSSYDILRAIWDGDGLGPDFQYPSHAGYGLDACCLANFNTEKSGNGALAPIDWQRGKIGDVIDYCLNDVRLTKQLLDKIMRDGYIRSPKDPSKLIEVYCP